MARLRGLLLLSLSVALLAGASTLACSTSVAVEDESADDVAPATEADKAKIDTFTRDGSAFDSAPPPSSSLGFLHATAQRQYSGFDGVHDFKVPVALRGGGADLQLTADDPSAATVARVTPVTPKEGAKTDYFMVTTKKAGLLSLTATSGTQKATVRISVAAYEPARWEAGEARYKNGAGSNAACTTCHVAGKALDHSPTALAAVTDGDVAKIMTLGEKPGPKKITEVDHRWTMDDDERRGLIVYLRGLDPRGFTE